MEEAWDTSGRFAEVFGTDDNPYFRRWSYTQKNYDGLKAVFPEHIKNGKLSPEVAARTKWL